MKDNELSFNISSSVHDEGDFHYLSGFGNHFSSEALAGALPPNQNSPLICPYGLYAEQISGTSFTAPRKLNLRRFLVSVSFMLFFFFLSTLFDQIH